MSNTQEVSTLDEKYDEQVSIHQIQIGEKDREFLSVLYNSDEPLTTAEIRERSGLDRREIDYRYDKFGRERYTEIIDVSPADPSILNRQVQGMNEAEMTEEGRKFFDMGLVGDPSGDYTQEEVVINKEKLESMQERMQMMETRIDSLQEKCDLQQETIEHNQYLGEKANGGVSYLKPAVVALTLVVRDCMDDVDFSRYLESAREQIREEK
ncbi:hypothetical protein G3I44_13635 [Halogeometricum borinquense]|uniref:Uncharacterized protein n=1 Tax=Halogeometricum borinquense TaxID=60847 RepID=A0A6C0UII1_9EURY|nr:hypothetical protein [Halogeometricum borinquense]QIB75235.1 hypothetical protein G3I44_13635 [Halogeometricum borinquense]